MVLKKRFYLGLKRKLEVLFNLKKSQGHVEMILSFLLFAGFIIFLFAFFNPITKSGQKLPVENIQKKIMENMSVDVGKLSVIVNTTNDCYSLNEVNKIYGNNFIEIYENDKPRRYTIYYGNFFEHSLIGLISCGGAPDRNYTLGLYTEEKILVYDKITDLKNRYELNYFSLKENLNIRDFSFNFRDFEGNNIEEISVSKKIPENVDVYSKDIPIRIIDNRANIREVILNLRVW